MGQMKRIILSAVLIVFALPALSARASDLCSVGKFNGLGGRCSFEPPSALAAGSVIAPVFALTGQGRDLTPLPFLRSFSFQAAFTGSHFGSTSVVASSKALFSGLPGRPSFAGADGVGGIDNVGIFSGFGGDDWFRHPTGDGWYRLKYTWGPGTMGFWDPSPNQLDDTPEPFTLLLFGTGLLMIAFLARHRVGAPGSRS